MRHRTALLGAIRCLKSSLPNVPEVDSAADSAVVETAPVLSAAPDTSAWLAPPAASLKSDPRSALPSGSLSCPADTAGNAHTLSASVPKARRTFGRVGQPLE